MTNAACMFENSSLLPAGNLLCRDCGEGPCNEGYARASALTRVLTEPDHVMREFRDDIRSIVASIEHWEEDKRHNLCPTDCSLAAAKTKAQAILRRIS